MLPKIKALIQSLENPLETHSAIDKFYHMMIRSCIIIHIGYFLLFLVIGLWPMMIYNIFSICFFIVLSSVPGKLTIRRINLALHFEVVLHASLSILFLGWGFGFQYVILLMFSTAYVRPYDSEKKFSVISILELIAIILLKVYFWFFPPLSHLAYKTSIQELTELSHIVYSLLIMMVIAYINNTVTLVTKRAMEENNSKLKVLASFDPLTGLLNRRHLYESYELMRQAENEHSKLLTPYTVVIGDIDNFKVVNDRYGHDTGDYVLKTVAGILSTDLPKNTIVCRWGGEEFVLIFQDYSSKETVALLNFIMYRIRMFDFQYAKDHFKITMTFGVEDLNASLTLEDAISLADEKLYYGKNTGKNKVVIEKEDLVS